MMSRIVKSVCFFFLPLFLVQCSDKATIKLNQEIVDTNESSDAAPAGPTLAEEVFFVTFGDWGSGESAQKNVAKAIGDYCKTQICEFILTLGDNFYNEGVASTTDPLWNKIYHDVYDFLKLPFYVALGDHDSEGNIQAQVDYAKIDVQWHMPNFYYSIKLPLGSSTPVAEIFITYADDFDSTQQAWLVSALKTSTVPWKILVVHDPIYSNGYHGDDDAGINEDLIPIICNKIDLVLSGDEHSFSHLRSAADGCPIEQLIIGTAGAGLRDVDFADPRVVFTKSSHGFGWLKITKEKIFFRFITDTLQFVYETSKEKKV